ncbi:helix-turn-helix domain-containing protein [Labrys sp. 22185]|uniref:helix-turn-helix domain-containing protein n=1 Tax=Labrys sp. 22185 TaxID=3453888 RepID=UPI003F83FB36
MTALAIDPSEIKITDHRAIRARLMAGRKAVVELHADRPSAVVSKLARPMSLRAPERLLLIAGLQSLTPAALEAGPDAVSQYREVPVRQPGAAPARILIADILRAVAMRWGVRQADILGRRRLTKVVEPRAVVMALAHHLTMQSLPEIGRRLDGRDHTTVLHHVGKLAPMIDAIEAAIGDGAPLECWVDAAYEACLMARKGAA